VFLKGNYNEKSSDNKTEKQESIFSNYILDKRLVWLWLNKKHNKT